MKKYGLLFSVILLCQLYASYTLGQGFLRNDITTTHTNGITINEISARSAIVDFNADGSTSSGLDKDEFIEIINNSSSDIDIGGWKIGDNNTNFTFASNTIIKASHGLIIFTRAADVSNFNPGTDNLVISATGGTTLALSNVNDAIGLRNIHDLYIEIVWGTGTLTSSITTGATLVGSSISLSSWSSGITQTRNPDYTGGWSTSPVINGTVNWSNDSPTIELTDVQGSPDRFIDGTPLPVELSSFSAGIISNGIKLNWRTETEVNNYGFEILRSTQNERWSLLGFVEGHGNSNSPEEYSFIDDNVTSGIYAYRLKQIDNDGTFEYSKVIEIDVDAPLGYELSQNYPNPFNPTTTIKFSIPVTSNVKLSVFNILGEEVQIIVNETKEAGIHTINFDASQLNSGIYFYKLKTRNFFRVKKMNLIR